MKDVSNNVSKTNSALTESATMHGDAERTEKNMEASENILRDELMGSVRYFFLNCPFEEAKSFLWDFYTGWVHHYDDVDSREHSAMLMFYEHMIELIKDLHKIDEEYLLNEP